ncbi:Amino acid transporter, transmembrane domain containing protein [Parasponia andersonii]|uniref:Amino acid transporter, transmembrane domain containing protein n=1 Tax=Parasponia andersonii TaxID=3476 RepID=A0A2P5BEL4_PARAD|nr:Amino acid transporter, transmembrane domain containing protein [Parasponia andersonii]
MGGTEDEEQSPLIGSFSSSDHDSGQLLKRTGTTWTAVAHIITGVIGAGVLSLSWSVAQLGWIAGPLLMVVFAAVTIVSTNLISDCYRYPDPQLGPARCPSYMEAVRLYLGEKWQYVCGVFVQQSLYGCGIAYTITSANSIRAIQRSNCYHEEGSQAACSYGDSVNMLLFGALQILVSQIPDFHNMAWLSVIAAIMSFAYSFIGFGLGFTKVIQNGTIQGSIAGVPASNMIEKLCLAFQAIGDLAFAYPYSVILLEIQDTLKSPPSESQTMKKASVIAIFVTTVFYLCCGCFGYAAFGNNTPGNLLTGFDFFEPYWLIDFANACIVLHLVGGYQIYSQPVFAVVERWFSRKYPNSRFVNKFYSFKLPLLPLVQLNLLRLSFRTTYVVSTTGIAMLFPYFNQVLGVSGALSFWPMAIYFPVEMYFVQKKIQPWTRKWIVLRTFSFLCFLVTVMGVIGSLEGLVSAKFS